MASENQNPNLGPIYIYIHIYIYNIYIYKSVLCFHVFPCSSCHSCLPSQQGFQKCILNSHPSVALPYLPSTLSQKHQNIEQQKLPWCLCELMLLALKKPFETENEGKKRSYLQEVLTILSVGVLKYLFLNPTALRDLRKNDSMLASSP